MHLIGLAPGEREKVQRPARTRRLSRCLRHAIDILWDYAPVETTTISVLIRTDLATGQSHAEVTWREDGVAIATTVRDFHCERAVAGSWSDLASALVMCNHRIDHSIAGEKNLSAAVSQTDRSKMLSFVSSAGERAVSRTAA